MSVKTTTFPNSNRVKFQKSQFHKPHARPEEWSHTILQRHVSGTQLACPVHSECKNSSHPLCFSQLKHASGPGKWYTTFTSDLLNSSVAITETITCCTGGGESLIHGVSSPLSCLLSEMGVDWYVEVIMEASSPRYIGISMPWRFSHLC
jgi:hypothetical protein